MYSGTFVSSELGQGTTGWLGECCFGVMYGEWYGVCDFVVLSVAEVGADYGGVNVFHVWLNFGVVYGVGVCVNVCGVFCVVVCCLFSYVWVLFLPLGVDLAKHLVKQVEFTLEASKITIYII